MKKPGEKGKCLSCKYVHSGVEQLNAWCMAKNMRFICGVTINLDGPKLKPEVLRDLHKGKLINMLGNRVNPNWCPYRQEKGDVNDKTND